MPVGQQVCQVDFIISMIAGLLGSLSNSPPVSCKCAWHMAPNDHTLFPHQQGRQLAVRQHHLLVFSNPSACIDKAVVTWSPCHDGRWRSRACRGRRLPQRHRRPGHGAPARPARAPPSTPHPAAAGAEAPFAVPALTVRPTDEGHASSTVTDGAGKIGLTVC